MDIEEMRQLVAQCEYADYQFEVLDRNGTALLVARYVEPDVVTNDPADQHTRKWHLSEHAVPSEIVQSVLLCVLTSQEHRVREHFLFRGVRAFGPHFDINALVELAQDKRLDYRGKKAST